ncbi:MAG: SDR family NAD(P)-dependent oxidoreductase [Armatimonadota bacterium]
MGILDLFSLEGRTALVTGSSSGIGQAQAVALAEAGATVAIHGSNPDKIAETTRLIEAVGGTCHASLVPLDGERDTCRRLVDDAAEALGGLDIVINCAGTNRRKRIEDVEPDDWEAIFRVNLDSVFWVSQAARPHLCDRGGGKILHIGSLTTFRGLGMLGPYAATKAAVGRLTETMAVEWARYDIQVNCLAPGFIETPLTKQGLFGDPVRRRWIMERVPARRPGYPSDLVGATLFLCSPASDFVTGQTLAVDGGFLTGGSWEIEPGD